MSAALESFSALVAREDARIELARACLHIAEDAYPGLDIGRYLADLERMAIRLRGRLPETGGAEARVDVLNRFLFDELGYCGNTEHYYDPRNSYLNEVMERRTGIPITLAVLYIELGRRIGLPLEGVSFPGHFLVRLRLRSRLLTLDPFCGGALQSEEDLRERLLQVAPHGAAAPAQLAALPLEQFLDPATHRQMLARLLRNLMAIYREADEPLRMLEVLNRMLVVSPQARAELRERGLLYRRLECWGPALRDLSAYLAREPGAPDAHELRGSIAELASRVARLS